MNKITAISLTISDSRNKTDDISGKVLIECLQEINAEIIDKLIITDDLDNLVETLKVQSERVNLIITTGGTGFSPRDNTPEATKQIIEKEAPGLAELMRSESAKTTKFAWLSRGVCGIRGKCLIINLPGSPKGVRECFDIIKPFLPHAISLIVGNKEH